MGTRNLTMVVYKEKTVVAQYGQWDGYPEGQGARALKFLKNKKRIENLKRKSAIIKFVDDEKQKEIDAFFKSIGCKDGWMNIEQAEKYHQKYPMFSRNNGAEVLNMITKSQEKTIWLYDSSSFAADSLSNEWTYVIDLDKNTFEVYKGFNETELKSTERFYNMPIPTDAYGEYKQVKHVITYSLSDLPTEKQFIAEIEAVIEKRNLNEYVTKQYNHVVNDFKVNPNKYEVYWLDDEYGTIISKDLKSLNPKAKVIGNLASLYKEIE